MFPYLNHQSQTPEIVHVDQNNVQTWQTTRVMFFHFMIENKRSILCQKL